ncbi:MAG: hypothetical protein R3D43_14135 [Tepidamorphaceae bacterium]
MPPGDHPAARFGPEDTCAAPKFIRQFGPIDTVEPFPGQHHHQRFVTAPRDILTLHHRNGEAIDVPVRAVLRTNNANVIATTLITGMQPVRSSSYLLMRNCRAA